MGPINPDTGEAALSHMTQSPRSTAMPQHDFRGHFVARPWEPPRRRTLLVRTDNNELEHRLRQAAVQAQDCDEDLMETKLELEGPDRVEPMSVKPGKSEREEPMSVNPGKTQPVPVPTPFHGDRPCGGQFSSS